MSEESKTPSLNGDGRDSQGRFTLGNSGGTGNPFTKVANQFRAALYAATSEDDIKAMAQALIKRVKEKGDPAAASVLFDRLWGKAPQAIELSGPEGQPVRISAERMRSWPEEKLNNFRAMLLEAATTEKADEHRN